MSASLIQFVCSVRLISKPLVDQRIRMNIKLMSSVAIATEDCGRVHLEGRLIFGLDARTQADNLNKNSCEKHTLNFMTATPPTHVLNSPMTQLTKIN